METKQAFAQFITQKRKEAGVTQEALAQALFVTHTTVSKWERGLSYPDIALVPEICRKLNISEHEFFTACEDLQARLFMYLRAAARFYPHSTRLRPFSLA